MYVRGRACDGVGDDSLSTYAAVGTVSVQVCSKYVVIMVMVQVLGMTVVVMTM